MNHDKLVTQSFVKMKNLREESKEFQRRRASAIIGFRCFTKDPSATHSNMKAGPVSCES